MLTNISSRQLLAARCTAGEQDPRYYLNGVHVLSSPTETRLIASNGAVLSAQRLAALNEFQGYFTIPNETIDTAAKFLKNESCAVDTDGARFALHADGGRIFPFVPCEGRFPDWQRIIPATVSGAPGDYDPDLVQLFVKAGKKLGAKGSLILRQSGTNAAIVQFFGMPDFCGVLMPMRLFGEKRPDPGLPTWAMQP